MNQTSKYHAQNARTQQQGVAASGPFVPIPPPPEDPVAEEYIVTLEAQVRLLEDAIRSHRSQKADDRCIDDDDRLYEALGDGIKCDRRVGCQLDMVKNCVRFIQNRTEGGGWPTYAELEAEIGRLRAIRDVPAHIASGASHIMSAFEHGAPIDHIVARNIARWVLAVRGADVAAAEKVG